MSWSQWFMKAVFTWENFNYTLIQNYLLFIYFSDETSHNQLIETKFEAEIGYRKSTSIRHFEQCNQ